MTHAQRDTQGRNEEHLRLIRLLRVMTLVLGVAGPAQAQTVYRIEGPDGKVTYSDKAPSANGQGKVVGSGAGRSSATSSVGLPYALRQITSQYPVTLYSGTNCGPCDAARAFLLARGVPFAERSVTTNEDIAALQRLSGESSLPWVTMGGQRMSGFSDYEWTRTLDAAGYPKTSLLPAGYKNPPAAPLIAVTPATPAAPKPAPSVPSALPPTGKTPDNPTGIVF